MWLVKNWLAPALSHSITQVLKWEDTVLIMQNIGENEIIDTMALGPSIHLLFCSYPPVTLLERLCLCCSVRTFPSCILWPHVFTLMYTVWGAPRLYPDVHSVRGPQTLLWFILLTLLWLQKGALEHRQQCVHIDNSATWVRQYICQRKHKGWWCFTLLQWSSM